MVHLYCTKYYAHLDWAELSIISLHGCLLVAAC